VIHNEDSGMDEDLYATRPGTYKFHWLSPKECMPHSITLPTQPITFHSHTDLDTPLPNAKFLSLHAVNAMVLHMSGVGEHIDGILQELEASGVTFAQKGRGVGGDDLCLWMALRDTGGVDHLRQSRKEGSGGITQVGVV